MILVHIGTKNEQQAIEIANYLIEECLLLEVRILSSVDIEHQNEKVIKSDSYLILGKTKALLFDTIDKSLREKYGKNSLSLYSVPIVNMNWEETAKLRDQTVKV